MGYLPDSKKYFTIVADSVSPDQNFDIIDETNNVVFKGNLGSNVIDDSEISGEQVLVGDFSDLKSQGRYKIRVGDDESFFFEINEEVFDSTLLNSLRFFYLARANHEKNDDLTGLTHGEAHIEEFNINDGFGNTIDVSGGWYNAGDFGKWVHTTAFACEHLLNLFEVNENYFHLQNLHIPESDNEIPDLLDQVKVGLEWLLKMQRPDGSVFHKVDSEPDFAYGYGPDEDPHSRKVADSENLSTIDAADFTAVMAHASRIFQKYDSVFAENCKSAALLSWDWVQANPEIGQNDIYYTDQQSWQEELWAKAEIYLISGNAALLGNIYNEIVSKNVSSPTWTQPHLFAYMKLFHAEGVPVNIKNWIKLKVENYANELKSVVEDSGYGCANNKFSWGWGSNTRLSNAGATFIYAYLITGNTTWLELANQQLDYLLGRNSLNFSFVTGAGSNSCRQPFHWITKTYKIVPEGWIGQGAIGQINANNGSYDRFVVELNEAEFPPAKTYVDTVDSWNSNETGIYEISSFAYLMGFLALHQRNISTNNSAQILRSNQTLEIIDRNRSLYCNNCVGKTSVSVYSADGSRLFSDEINTFSGLPVLNYRGILKNNSFAMYRVTDETGRTASGKIALFTD